MLSLRTIGSLASRGMAMVMTTHDPNHAFLFPGRVVLMQQGGAIVTGPAADIVTDAALSSTFGVDIAVVSVPNRNGSGESRICSPWLI